VGARSRGVRAATATITTRPMRGTGSRSSGLDADHDRAARGEPSDRSGSRHVRRAGRPSIAEHGPGRGSRVRGYGARGGSGLPWLSNVVLFHMSSSSTDQTIGTVGFWVGLGIAAVLLVRNSCDLPPVAMPYWRVGRPAPTVSSSARSGGGMSSTAGGSSGACASASDWPHCARAAARRMSSLGSHTSKPQGVGRSVLMASPRWFSRPRSRHLTTAAEPGSDGDYRRCRRIQHFALSKHG
jgi:hypothetical protein